MAPSPFGAVVQTGFWSRLFDSSSYPPRWECGDWTPFEGWLHIASDIGIWAAYTAIPFALFLFLGRRPGWPLRPVVWLFIAFILACGATHLIEVVLFWNPIYRFAGVVKALTAVVSLATVVMLGRVLPYAMSLRSPAELEREVAARTDELERSRAEAESARAAAERANRAKESFLSDFHAEARTPIDAMLSHAKRLLEHPAGNGEARSNVEALARHGKYLQELLHDVLDPGATNRARFGLTPANVPLRALVDQALDMALQASSPVDGARDERIEVSLGGGVPDVVRVDPLRLRQVLVNLVETALRARDESEDGSARAPRVRLDARAAGRQRLWLSVRVTAPHLRLSEQDRAAVFLIGSDDATRGKPKPVALLDLMIARRITEAMGGELLVADHPEGGVELSADVPVSTPSATDREDEALPLPERAPPPTEEELQPVSMRVLLIDVSSVLVERTVEHLRRIGAECHVATGAALAAAAIKREHSQGRRFDAVLLDLDLPAGEADEALELLLASGYRGPVVPLASYSRSRPAQREHEGLHTTDALVKPVSALALFRALGAVIADVRGSEDPLALALARHAGLEATRRRARST